MKKILFVALLVCTAVACSSTSAEAYFTTGQVAHRIDDTHALFVIEYTFGLEKHDLYMPAVSASNLLQKTDSKKVGFEVVKNGRDTVSQNNVTAAVISRAPAKEGMYLLEKGAAHKMWLVALLETTKDEHEADYALKVTHLPFYADMGEKELDARKLNPTELQYYTTKEVELNTGNFN